MATALGWDYRPPDSELEAIARPTTSESLRPDSQAGDPRGPGPAPTPSPAEQERTRNWPGNAVAATLWMPVAHKPEATFFDRQPQPVAARLEWRDRPKQPAVRRPLTSWAVLGPRLRAVFADLLQSRECDVERTIERLSAGGYSNPFVFRPWRRWGRSLQVLVDRSQHLMPYFDDQERVVAKLRDLLGTEVCEVYWGRGPQLSEYFRLKTIHPASELPLADSPDRSRADPFNPPPFDPIVMYQPPPPGTRVLVLGDLGSLLKSEVTRSVALPLAAHDAANDEFPKTNLGESGVPMTEAHEPPQSLANPWLAIGQTLRQRGCQPLALVPCDLTRVPDDLRNCFRVRGWGPRESGTVKADAKQALVDDLLALISVCVRVEPGLLRACRRLLSGAGDPGLESDVWQDRLFVNWTSDAAEPGRSERVEQCLRRFESLPSDLRRELLRLLREYRLEVGCEVFFEELSRLSEESRAILKELAPHDWDDAIAGLTYLREYVSRQDPRREEPVSDYSRRLLRRLSHQTLVNSQLGPAVAALQRHLTSSGKGPGGATAVDRLTVSLLEDEFWVHTALEAAPWTALPEKHKRVVSLRTRGGGIHVEVDGDGDREGDGDGDGHNGGPATRSRGRLLSGGESWRFSVPPGRTITLTTDMETVRLERSTRPIWADQWGVDRFGPWAETVFGAVNTKWRWIPPGSFWMGSPESEPGRWDDEGPQHGVTLTHGYWMMETPCMQRLWAEFMGQNSSRFKDPERPVEQVSWNDVQQFITAVGNRYPHLKPRLPTEAQWEYACRAGSSSAIYPIAGTNGHLSILGEHNAPALDPIAWYGGNSGARFELKNGWDSSSWKEKQFPHNRAGTRRVAVKQPNAWGLYDMLGNVWEWCADGKRPYRDEPAIDPDGGLTGVGSRCVRGGSWRYDARYVRCACRGEDPPESRSEILGFRLVRVQDGS